MKISQLCIGVQPSRETAVTNTPGSHSAAGIAGLSVQMAGIVFVVDPIGCMSQVGQPGAPPVPLLLDVVAAVVDADADTVEAAVVAADEAAVAPPVAPPPVVPPL